MPKFVHEQTSFNAGILSPKLLGQTSLSQYLEGLKDSSNIISTKYGPASKRTGTNFIFPVKDPTKYQRLIPFKFSRDQNLVLEFGAGYIRFMTFDATGVGLVPDPNNPSIPYEVTTPFSESEVASLDYTQSADVLYLTHTKYNPKQLARKANNNWTLSDITFLDGPYVDMNTDKANTLTPSATSGTAVTITAIKDTFTANDVGRYLRLHNQTGGAVSWGYGLITAFTSTKVVTVSVIQNFATTSASAYWRLGAWNSFRGYPKACTIHQQRLMFGGGSEQQTYWGSNTTDYTNFAPSDIDGTVKDSHAITYNLATEEFNSINWILSFRSLLTGTTGSEFRLYSSGSVLTPSDRVANRESSFGTADIKPIIIDDFIVFLQKLNRKVRLFEYDYTTDSYTGPDLTLLADHLTVGGVYCMAYQKEPYSILWAAKNDGILLSLVIDKAQKVYAWNTHDLSGGKVRSMAVVPSEYYRQDTLFLIVERVINGVTKKYIEILSPEFSEDKTHADACFLDCSMRYQGTSTKTITGLSHLEGQTVCIMNQGAREVDKVVSGGKIDLDYPVTDAWIGLGYSAWIETLEPALNMQGKSYRNSKKQISDLILSVYRTLGVSLYQIDMGEKTKVIMAIKKDGVAPNSVPDLITDDCREKPQSRSGGSPSLRIESYVGQPFTLRSLVVEILSSDQ